MTDDPHGMLALAQRAEKLHEIGTQGIPAPYPVYAAIKECAEALRAAHERETQMQAALEGRFVTIVDVPGMPYVCTICEEGSAGSPAGIEHLASCPLALGVKP